MGDFLGRHRIGRGSSKDTPAGTVLCGLALYAVLSTDTLQLPVGLGL
jgi:hypothetical protein